jgi:hypothetical protein
MFKWVGQHWKYHIVGVVYMYLWVPTSTITFTMLGGEIFRALEHNS